ncbi:fimbrial protein [Burkholderia ubonensis]|uniref:fimbrial protein n=1 Tax=Burkholderia ubonensis TaxID=101571 RepID=UPI0009B30951
MMWKSNGQIDASSGLLALTSTSTARGVAIQLPKAGGNPAPLGTPWNVSDSPPSSSASITVPLLARYYQIDATAAPGTADGIAIFTIVYR